MLLVALLLTQVTLAHERPPNVREYKMCKHVTNVSPFWCMPQKNTFNEEDEKAYAWVKLGKFSESHIALWKWYGPNNKLYTTFTHEIPSAAEEGWEWWDWYVIWGWIGIKGNDAAYMPGNWRVETYIDGRLVTTQSFEIQSSLLPLFPSPSPKFGNQRSIFVPYEGGEAVVDTMIRKASLASGLNSNWVRAKLVVDTGASISVFPRTFARELSINLRSGDPLTLTDVSGSTIDAWSHQIEIALEAPDGTALSAIQIEAAFAENDKVPYLLGRLDVLDQVNINFQPDGFTISIK